MQRDLSAYRAVDPIAVMDQLGYTPAERYSNTVEYRLLDGRKIAISISPRNAKGGSEFLFNCWNGETFKQDKRGGAGAIDLVLTVTGLKFAAAVAWLTEHFFSGNSPAPLPPRLVITRREPHRMPTNDPEGTKAMRAYLCNTRGFPPRIVDTLIARGIIYPNIHRYESQGKARSFTNTVFVMRDDTTLEPVGAMIRGCYDGTTTRKSTLPLVSGSDAAFWVGEPLESASIIVLAESPIECISYRLLHPSRGLHCRAYGGNRWGYVRNILPRLKGRHFVCAFNNDAAGTAYAQELATMCQSAGIDLRLCVPLEKDWNQQLLRLQHPSI